MPPKLTPKGLFELTDPILRKMTPPKIDAYNAVLDRQFALNGRDLDSAWHELYTALLLKQESVRSGNGHTRRWPMGPQEAQKLALEHIEQGYVPDQRERLRHGIRDADHYAGGLRSALGMIDYLRGERKKLKEGPQAVLDAEFLRRGGWSRFVEVPDGHLHRGRQCHTIRPTTETIWHPELSGRSAEVAVKAHGPFLCSHCYKDAPTEWQLNPAEERAKEKAKTECPGSRQYVELSSQMARRVSKYATCPVCGKRGVSVTSTWKLRAHKPEAEGEQ